VVEGKKLKWEGREGRKEGVSSKLRTQARNFNFRSSSLFFALRLPPSLSQDVGRSTHPVDLFLPAATIKVGQVQSSGQGSQQGNKEGREGEREGGQGRTRGAQQTRTSLREYPSSTYEGTIRLRSWLAEKIWVKLGQGRRDKLGKRES